STLTAAQVGTTAAPQIVYVNGDATLGNLPGGGGTGILVVTGTLTLKGNFDYHGLVLVVGDGILRRDGGGNGTITGSIFVANTKIPDPNPTDPNDPDYQNKVGIPEYDVDGGGISTIAFDPGAADITSNNFPLKIKSWRQL
ncbi:MAG: hypothetical protein K0A94_06695, partial [Desulfuromonadales bacterium]|nr:hypothetical protein [Desulfuromonadales bacterium]